MREIEFQAWDIINQKMIKSPMAIVSGDGGWVLFTSEIENLDCYNAVHPIQQYKIRQFIGRKDRDGQKIYEGDIVSLETGPDADFPSTGNYEVYWSDEKWYGARWQLRDGEGEDYNNGVWDDDRIEWEECRVVGSIYENPELLNSTR